MENVYLDLNVESEWKHPDNSGWMNVFNRWTWSSMFRVTWAVSAATYGRRFRSFCRLRLGLELGNVHVAQVFSGIAPDKGFTSAPEESRLNVVERTQIERLLTSDNRLPNIEVYRLHLRVALEENLSDDQRLLRTFGFGYAIVSDDELVMFRVQDHLRNMELGRLGLEVLVNSDVLKRTELKVRDTIYERLRNIGERIDPGRISGFKTMLRSVQLARGSGSS